MKSPRLRRWRGDADACLSLDAARISCIHQNCLTEDLRLASAGAGRSQKAILRFGQAGIRRNRSRMATCAQRRQRRRLPKAGLATNHTREVLRKMTKEEAIALQAAVDEIPALAVEKRSEIGGAVNWGDLLCLDAGGRRALQVCERGACAARIQRDRGQDEW
jgi:hypothetical protein